MKVDMQREKGFKVRVYHAMLQGLRMWHLVSGFSGFQLKVWASELLFWMLVLEHPSHGRVSVVCLVVSCFEICVPESMGFIDITEMSTL